jgi:hypothetical protein
MNRTNTVLTVVFVVQAALAAVSWWPTGAGKTDATAFLDMLKGDITEITVVGFKSEDETKDPVTLRKSGDKWVVSTAGNYPADGDKADELVQSLVDLTVRRPVATQALSQKSLKVAENSFGKKVTVSTSAKTVTFYAGAAAANQLHLRREGEDEVFAARGLSEWGIRDTVTSFIDTTYLETEDANIDSLTVVNAAGTFQFHKDAGAWNWSELPEGESLNAEKIDQLTKKLTKVRLSEPLGTPAPEHGLDGSMRVLWTLTDASEGSEQPTTTESSLFIGTELDNGYAVKAQNNPYAVKVTKYGVRDFVELTATDLLVEPDSEDEEG